MTTKSAIFSSRNKDNEGVKISKYVTSRLFIQVKRNYKTNLIFSWNKEFGVRLVDVMSLTMRRMIGKCATV